MKRVLISAVLLVVALGGTAFAYVWFSGGSGEPSTELTTPPIAASTTTTTVPAETTMIAVETTTTVAETTTTALPNEAFVIQSDQSIASFTLNEVLRGEPTTVVGTTSEVAGQFALDAEDLSATAFSPMVVNARTFTTGSSTRDRAIRGPIILNSASDEFEFITFEVTSIDGLDGSASVGDTLDFMLTGDLTIRGVTNTEQFNVSATLVDEQTIEGIASTQVLRSDYEIGIPSVSSVADVTDEVMLELDFTATR